MVNTKKIVSEDIYIYGGYYLNGEELLFTLYFKDDVDKIEINSLKDLTNVKKIIYKPKKKPFYLVGELILIKRFDDETFIDEICEKGNNLYSDNNFINMLKIFSTSQYAKYLNFKSKLKAIKESEKFDNYTLKELKEFAKKDYRNRQALKYLLDKYFY